MKLSKEEENRILFIVNEVMRNLDKGARIEIRDAGIDVKIWRGHSHELYESIYFPIKEDDVYKVIVMLRDTLDRIEEEKLELEKEIEKGLKKEAAEEEDEDD